MPRGPGAERARCREDPVSQGPGVPRVRAGRSSDGPAPGGCERPLGLGPMGWGAWRKRCVSRVGKGAELGGVQRPSRPGQRRLGVEWASSGALSTRQGHGVPETLRARDAACQRRCVPETLRAGDAACQRLCLPETLHRVGYRGARLPEGRTARLALRGQEALCRLWPCAVRSPEPQRPRAPEAPRSEHSVVEVEGVAVARLHHPAEVAASGERLELLEGDGRVLEVLLRLSVLLLPREGLRDSDEEVLVPVPR